MSDPTLTLWFGSNEETGDSDLESAIEREIRNRYDDELGPWTLTEYDVHPPSYHLPHVDAVLDQLAYLCEDGETDEGWYEQLLASMSRPEVRAAAAALLALVGDGISYRMAREQIGVHVLTRTNDGKVLLDGEHVDDWQPDAPATNPVR